MINVALQDVTLSFLTLSFHDPQLSQDVTLSFAAFYTGTR